MRAQVMYRHVEPGQQRPKSEVTAEHIVEKLAKRHIELSPEQVRADNSRPHPELPRSAERTA